MNKLYKTIDEYCNNKDNFLPLEDWNSTKHSNLISIDSSGHTPIGLIKSCNLDLAKGIFTYTLTKNPKDALRFDGDVSSMLYHHLKYFNSNIKHHSHYPVKLLK